MIQQGTTTLHTIQEMTDLLLNNNKKVLGIDKWYKNNTSTYYEVPAYDFSSYDVSLTNEEIIQLITLDKEDIMYSIIIDE